MIPFAWESEGSSYQRICPELSWIHRRKRKLLAQEFHKSRTGLALTTINLRAIEGHVKKGYLKPLTGVFPTKDLKGYFQPVLEMCSFQGVLYGIPEDFTPYVLIARKDILRKHSLAPPRTWKELEVQAKKLFVGCKEPPIAPLGGKHFSPLSFLGAMLSSNGLTSAQAFEEIFSNQEIYADAYQWIQKGMKEGWLDVESLDPENYRTEDFFNRGKWVYRFCWLGDLKLQSEDFWKNVHVLSFPTGPSGKRPITLIHGHAWIVPANSIAPELGVQALRRITAPKVILKEEADRRGYPFHARKDIWKNPILMRRQPAYRQAKFFLESNLYTSNYASKRIQQLALDLIPSLKGNKSAEIWLSKSPRKPNQNVHQIVKKAVEYLEAHAHENLTLHDLANEVGVSERHLHRLFKEEMRITAADYLKNLKMEEARRLLKTTALSIKEVASKTGFDYLEAFSRAFRRHWGKTPSSFRENARAKGRK